MLERWAVYVPTKRYLVSLIICFYSLNLHRSSIETIVNLYPHLSIELHIHKKNQGIKNQQYKLHQNGYKGKFKLRLLDRIKACNFHNLISLLQIETSGEIFLQTMKLDRLLLVHKHIMFALY